MFRIFFYWVFLLSLHGCISEDGLLPYEPLDEDLIIRIQSSYEQMPEGVMTIDNNNQVIALYASPTTLYGHGILGDKIEARQLVVASQGVIHDLVLDDGWVFEDIRPRLYDVDGDNHPEIVTIRTKVTDGAGIAIYKIYDEGLALYAEVPVVGRAYRWLNIVTIDDLDNDGTIELLWVQTPHIGGILNAAPIKEGRLTSISSLGEYSNHAIGERNLCMSTTVIKNDQTIIYLPNQQGDSIVGLAYKDMTLHRVESFPHPVDFSIRLNDQISFTSNKVDQVNCIGG